MVSKNYGDLSLSKLEVEVFGPLGGVLWYVAMCVSRPKAKGFTRKEVKGSGEGSLIQCVIEKLTWKLKFVEDLESKQCYVKGRNPR